MPLWIIFRNLFQGEGDRLFQVQAATILPRSIESLRPQQRAHRVPIAAIIGFHARGEMGHLQGAAQTHRRAPQAGRPLRLLLRGGQAGKAVQRVNGARAVGDLLAQ